MEMAAVKSAESLNRDMVHTVASLITQCKRCRIPSSRTTKGNVNGIKLKR